MSRVVVGYVREKIREFSSWMSNDSNMLQGKSWKSVKNAIFSKFATEYSTVAHGVYVAAGIYSIPLYYYYYYY